eukprot:9475992-Pyramimonas_sp.AAC.1
MAAKSTLEASETPPRGPREDPRSPQKKPSRAFQNNFACVQNASLTRSPGAAAGGAMGHYIRRSAAASRHLVETK